MTGEREEDTATPTTDEHFERNFALHVTATVTRQAEAGDGNATCEQALKGGRRAPAAVLVEVELGSRSGGLSLGLRQHGAAATVTPRWAGWWGPCSLLYSRIPRPHPVPRGCPHLTEAGLVRGTRCGLWNTHVTANSMALTILSLPLEFQAIVPRRTCPGKTLVRGR